MIGVPPFLGRIAEEGQSAEGKSRRLGVGSRESGETQNSKLSDEKLTADR
jgi:hypothetical protein